MAAATATTPYVIISSDQHDTNTNIDDKITLLKKFVAMVLLTAGWTFVLALWLGKYLNDYSSQSYIFATCGFWLGVVGCPYSWYFKLGNFKQAITCNFLACLLFVILYYANVEDSTIYWTHGSIMLAGVAHIYLKSIGPLLKFVCSVPRMVLRGSM